MFTSLVLRTFFSVDKRNLNKFVFNFLIKGGLSIYQFRKRIKRNEYFPPFLYLSITNSCNLRCQGCWVDVDRPQQLISLERLNRIVVEAKEMGNRFFGILGGEPFMHPQLFDFLEEHPDCYFQIFTNGQMITKEIARRLRKIGNATPLISIEGDEIISDERRGRQGVYHKTLIGLENCLEEKLLTGVATSLCQTNIENLLTEQWLKKLIKMGVHYAWYHTYRPVGPQIHEELALNSDQATEVRKFVVEMRSKLPIGLIDAYYDADGEAVCPMATGISHHVGPTGGIEPCPIIQFATDQVEGTSLREGLIQSEFIRDFRETAAKTTRGCIVLERPDLVIDLAKKHKAKDTTIRQKAIDELSAMSPKPSQWQPAKRIPEKHWMYRLAKKIGYNDFGAYKSLNTHTLNN